MGARAPWILRHEPPPDSDEQLTDRARRGDQSAFGELYRRHRKAADSTARCLLRSRVDADDVVADAFAGVLSALRNGRGPRDNFRRYLLACVRNGCRSRRPNGVPVQEPTLERLAPVNEEPERYVEADTVARAFAALTPRWQYTLWLTAVEQRPAHEVSERMRLSPNAAAALTHRARQAFATAYLAEHVGVVEGRECVTHAPHLAAYVRGALAEAAEATVERHLVACRDCAVAAGELRDINTSLRSLSLPPPCLAAGAAATATAAATAGTAVVPGSAATTAAGAGIWAMLPGSAVLTKALVAVLVVAPMIGTERVDSAHAGRVGGHDALAAGPEAIEVAPGSAGAVADATFGTAPAGSVAPAGAVAVAGSVAAPAGFVVPDLAPVSTERAEVIDIAFDPFLDELLQPAPGSGIPGATISVLRSIVPLLAGARPLALLAGSRPLALSNLLTGLDDGDGASVPPSAATPVTPPTGVSPPHAPGSVAVPATVSHVAPTVTPGSPVGAPSVSIPDTRPAAVVEPATSVPGLLDPPPIAVLDVVHLDLPPVTIPSLAPPGTPR